jgi:hypothetical protein
MLAVAPVSDTYTRHVHCMHGLLTPLLTFAWPGTHLVKKFLPRFTAMALLKALGPNYSPRRICIASSAYRPMPRCGSCVVHLRVTCSTSWLSTTTLQGAVAPLAFFYLLLLAILFCSMLASTISWSPSCVLCCSSCT